MKNLIWHPRSGCQFFVMSSWYWHGDAPLAFFLPLCPPNERKLEITDLPRLTTPSPGTQVFFDLDLLSFVFLSSVWIALNTQIRVFFDVGVVDAPFPPSGSLFCFGGASFTLIFFFMLTEGTRSRSEITTLSGAERMDDSDPLSPLRSPLFSPSPPLPPHLLFFC